MVTLTFWLVLSITSLVSAQDSATCTDQSLSWVSVSSDACKGIALNLGSSSITHKTRARVMLLNRYLTSAVGVSFMAHRYGDRTR